MGNNPSGFQSPDRPVENISWDDCEEFLRQLDSLAPGLHARLPSEAEWEHACRAGTATATWLGDLEIRGDGDAPLLDSIAWYRGNSEEGTYPVGRRAPNPLGLYDMLGNVYEWCQDAFGSYDIAPVEDPLCPETNSNRVLRGGSWFSEARYIRAAYRFEDPSDNTLPTLGFRLARGQAPRSGPERGMRRFIFPPGALR